MNLIFGANGRIGRRVAAALVALGDAVRVFVRDVQAAKARFGSSVDIVCGDLDDADSVNSAMHDVSQVLLCSPVAPKQVEQQNRVVDAARGAAKPYVVKISGFATYPGSFVDSGRWHAETESYLAQSGLNYTCLHPYFFMQNLDFQMKQIQRSGVLTSGVAEAAIAMVDARDIAAAAVKLLSDPRLAPRQTLPLTTDQALTYADMARTMSAVFDWPVRFQAQTLAEVEENLRRAGQADWHIQLLLQFNRAFEEGYGSQPHPALADLLGRAPLTFADYLRSFDDTSEGANPFPS